MVKLINIQAAEAAHFLGVGVNNAHVDNELPESIAAIVDKTFIFQLKLIEFNFTPKHQTVTISRIISQSHDSPLPEFFINGSDHGTNDDMPRENPVASIRSLLVTTILMLSYQMGVR
ncbi:hypothetical protein Bca4012_037514 [Brassica carinata]